MVLPKGSHLNGHTDGLLIHQQTQTLELHAISTKLKSRPGGGGGGRGVAWCGCAFQFSKCWPYFRPKTNTYHPLVVPLKTIPDFVPTWAKSIPVVRPKRARKLYRFHGRHPGEAHTFLMEVVSFLGTICFTVIPCVVREQVNHK